MLEISGSILAEVAVSERPVLAHGHQFMSSKSGHADGRRYAKNYSLNNQNDTR